LSVIFKTISASIGIARSRYQQRGGFTLIELLIVISIIVALAAIGFPVWNSVRRKADVDSSRTLVLAVATAMASYPIKTWEVYSPQVRVYRMWDINRDGYIDGTPGVTASTTVDGGFLATVVDSGYGGFISMAQPAISKRNVNKKRQVIDAWGQPLRIGFGSEIYGPGGFGIWSAGQNKKDYHPTNNPTDNDDLCSWKSSDE